MLAADEGATLLTADDDEGATLDETIADDEQVLWVMVMCSVMTEVDLTVSVCLMVS